MKISVKGIFKDIQDGKDRMEYARSDFLSGWVPLPIRPCKELQKYCARKKAGLALNGENHFRVGCGRRTSVGMTYV